MKNKIFGCLIAATIFVACNNKTADAKNNQDTLQTKSSTGDVVVTPQPPIADTAKAVSIKEIVNNYLQLKNAFTKDNTNNAATAGASLQTVFKNFDKTALNAEQKKLFEEVADDATEHAEHIAKNGGNIAHQREHFEMLSKDIADLIKTFGNGGQTLYKDFCPMANNNKGAYWISETKDIKNPYLGKAMPTCGSVKETIQ